MPLRVWWAKASMSKGRRAISRRASGRGPVHVALAGLAALLGCAPASPPGRFDAVVQIVTDPLRVDHLGVHGHVRPTSPRIDARARGAVVFDHAFAPSPWTAPSMGFVFTEAWPSRRRAGELRRSGEGRIVLVHGREAFLVRDPHARSPLRLVGALADLEES